MKHLLPILCLFMFSCDSGSTTAVEIEGCTDESACNYDESANLSNYDLCTYAEQNFDCDGNCLLDFDECGECGGDNSCYSTMIIGDWKPTFENGEALDDNDNNFWRFNPDNTCENLFGCPSNCYQSLEYTGTYLISSNILTVNDGYGESTYEIINLNSTNLELSYTSEGYYYLITYLKQN